MLDALQTGLESAWQDVAGFTPKLISAFVILIIGAVVAKVIRAVVTRLMEAVKVDANLGRVLDKAGLPAESISVTKLVGLLLYWLVMVVTLQAVAETLGAATLAATLMGVIAYIPIVLVAGVILVATLMIADFVGDLMRESMGAKGRIPSMIVKYAIIAFGGFAALNQLQIAPEIVNGLFYALVGTAAISATIAFGVGGIPVARRITEESVAKRRTASPTTPPAPSMRVPEMHDQNR